MVYIFNEYQSSKINGIGIYLKQLGEIFETFGKDYSLINLNSDNEEFSIETNEGVTNYFFPPTRMNPIMFHEHAISTILGQYIQDSDSNIFMFNYTPAAKLMNAIKQIFPMSKLFMVIHDLSWTAMLQGDIKKLYTLNNDKEKYGKTIEYIETEKEMYTIADKIICLSQDTSNILSDFYKVAKEKIYLIPNGLKDSFTEISEDEKSKIRDKYYLSNNDKIIIHIGRINNIKGSFALISAMEKVLEEHPDSKLAIVGNIENSEQTFKLSNEFSSRIIFLGHLSQKQLSNWYKISDIGVIPSYTEQSSYVGIEMMMHGLPIVASDAFGVRNMFSDKNARIAKIEDYDKNDKYVTNLYSQLSEMLSSKENRARLKEQSRKTYLSRYTINKMSELYKQLIN